MPESQNAPSSNNANLFDKLVNALPIAQKCIRIADSKKKDPRLRPYRSIFLGIPRTSSHAVAPMGDLPDSVDGFNFLIDGDQGQIIQAFVKSPRSKDTKHLSIGTSSFSRECEPDYRSAISHFANADMPNLVSLQLGECQLYHNEHSAFGKLGDISTVLNACPNLIELGVFGQFQLSDDVSLKSLENIRIQIDDVSGLNGGPVSAETISNLLSADMPNLKSIILDLEFYGTDQIYEFPSRFLDQGRFEKLSKITIFGRFQLGSQEKVRKAFDGMGVTLQIDHMIEVSAPEAEITSAS